MTKKIIPLYDRILVAAHTEHRDKTKSGIYIPESANKEKPVIGKVIAVGAGKLSEDGTTKIALAVKVGDTVLFSKYGPDEVEIEGEKYLVIKEEQILAIIK